VQRFASAADLDAAECTVEEREEYEPHLRHGHVVYAGVDYGAILARAEEEADIVLWDGGNNDMSFYAPDLLVTLVDPLRPGHETAYHPGEAVLRMADIVLVAKADTAPAADVEAVTAAARAANPRARVIRGGSPVTAADPALLRGRRVLIVEDGPSITHGGRPWGAGYVAAQQAGAAEIVDPRAAAAPEIAGVFAKYPHIGPVLPAMGYGPAQLAALERTIADADAEAVAIATPCDLAALIAIDKPATRISYDYAELEEPGLGAAVDAFLDAR
jgi:predicted GTPase